jgi:hypothetical protein
MSALIDRNPAPEWRCRGGRESCHADIAARLEEPVSPRRLWVAAAVPLPGRDYASAPYNTVAMQDGRVSTLTFGLRENTPTKWISHHGVALDGKLALSEFPGRVLEPIGVRKNATRRTRAPDLVTVARRRKQP